MKRIAATTLLMLALGTPGLPAHAAGCIKGAVAGAVVGHVAGHHAVAGAVAGCVIGHHVAKKKAAEQRARSGR